MKDDKLSAAAFTDKIPNGKGGYHKYTPKEKLFIFEYLSDPRHVTWKAVKAAGYDAKSEAVFRVMASRLMKRPHVLAAINAAFESLTMPRLEILYRLGRIAAGSVEDVLNDDNELDLDLAKKNGTAHLIKKIERTRDVIEVKAETVGDPDDPEAEGETIERSIIKERVKFELHDPVRALELLGKNGRLFVDHIQALNKHGEPTDAQVIFYIPDNGLGDGDEKPK